MLITYSSLLHIMLSHWDWDSSCDGTDAKIIRVTVWLAKLQLIQILQYVHIRHNELDMSL